GPGGGLGRPAAGGPAGMVRGELAERGCEWGCERGGLLSVQDFDAYRAVERPPVRASYRGRDVLTNAPPSSGGILIAYALDLLERAPSQPVPGSADSLALLADVMEEANQVRVGADFNRDLHDPEFAERFLASSDRL